MFDFLSSNFTPIVLQYFDQCKQIRCHFYYIKTLTIKIQSYSIYGNFYSTPKQIAFRYFLFLVCFYLVWICMCFNAFFFFFFSMAGVPQLKSNVATNKQTSNGSCLSFTLLSIAMTFERLINPPICYAYPRKLTTLNLLHTFFRKWMFFWLYFTI